MFATTSGPGSLSAAQSRAASARKMPEVVSYAAGLTKIKFWKFFTIHNLVGIIPSVILVGSGGLLVSNHDPKIIALFFVVGTVVALIGGFFFWKYSENFSK